MHKWAGGPTMPASRCPTLRLLSEIMGTVGPRPGRWWSGTGSPHCGRVTCAAFIVSSGTGVVKGLGGDEHGGTRRALPDLVDGTRGERRARSSRSESRKLLVPSRQMPRIHRARGSGSCRWAGPHHLSGGPAWPTTSVTLPSASAAPARRRCHQASPQG